MVALGFDVVYARIYESPRYPDMRRRVPVFAAAIDSAATLMNLALMNRANVRCGDYHIVFRKR